MNAVDIINIMNNKWRPSCPGRAICGQCSHVTKREMNVMNVINMINMINDKWGPPGPGKAVWGLCRNHSGRMHTVDCLYGANPPPERGPLGSGGAAWGQCRDETKCHNKCYTYNECDTWWIVFGGCSACVHEMHRNKIMEWWYIINVINWMNWHLSAKGKLLPWGGAW